MNTRIANKTSNEIAAHHGLWFYLLACAVAIGLASPAAHAQTDSPLVVIGESASYAPGTLPRTGPWQALFCNEFGCEIREAEVKIMSGSAETLDDDVEQTESFLVEEHPVAVFHGLDLENGVIPAWYARDVSEDGVRQYRSLHKLGRWEMPWGSKPLNISWVKLPDAGGFRYHLGDGARKQFLFSTALESELGGDTAPIIHWVGDLDGDGKLDMLVSLPNDSCRFDQRLYLSSKARAGDWVGKPVRFAGSEANCDGC